MKITQFPKYGRFPRTRPQRPLPTYEKALGTCPYPWETCRYRSGGFAAEETGRFQIDRFGMLWNIKMPPAACRTVENSHEAVESIVMVLLMNNLVWTRGCDANKLRKQPNAIFSDIRTWPSETTREPGCSQGTNFIESLERVRSVAWDSG